ncbi:hypothetical protein J5J86_20925 [Aquabacter sp. L1I39]|uniref:hypothetical protein n=1 Tax=Aquabacter sp. L1I39 TaxID=2820278 RepID=UPI001ADB4200|nr:hypothetical protein [Aquabacter sp. L1I39]QTL03187.1 hypothetical protein J5J86_20925 [Aquabacter sp. L1I39]
MTFGLPFRSRRPAAPMAGPSSIPAWFSYVVARAVEAAPSRFIFFDGRETAEAGAAGAVIVPGGAFFLDEARLYGDRAAAEGAAARLNARRPAGAEHWVVVSTRRVLADQRQAVTAMTVAASRASLSRR